MADPRKKPHRTSHSGRQEVRAFAATVTAEEPSRLLVVGHREFHSLLGTHPKIQLEILQALAQRVRRLGPEAAQ